MEGHRQAWAKVNAPVDEGVRGIVEALSAFPSLETVESCQGRETSGPWVCFRYGCYWEHPWRDLSEFVLGYMAPELTRIVGDGASVRIQVTPSGVIFGELSVRPGAASEVEAALRKLLRTFSGDLRHTSECCGGTFDT